MQNNYKKIMYFVDTATWIKTENYVIFIHILGSGTYSHLKKIKQEVFLKKKIHRLFACTFSFFPHNSRIHHYTALQLNLQQKQISFADSSCKFLDARNTFRVSIWFGKKLCAQDVTPSFVTFGDSFTGTSLSFHLIAQHQTNLQSSS